MRLKSYTEYSLFWQYPSFFITHFFIYYYIFIYNKIPISILYSCENKTVYCILYTMIGTLEHIISYIEYSNV